MEDLHSGILIIVAFIFFTVVLGAISYAVIKHLKSKEPENEADYFFEGLKNSEPSDVWSKWNNES